MRTYTRINEDYLDNSTIDTEDISMHDEICSEIDRWLNSGPVPSFDLNRLADAFYSVCNKNELSQIIELCMSLYGNECNLNWIDVSKVKEMTFLFENSSFNGDISRWDVSDVKDMRAMFKGSYFNGDISEWDVSRVRYMQLMFTGCPFFNSDISGWDTSSVTEMYYMFSAADNFNQDLSKWNVSRVTTMRAMFRDSAIDCDLSGWDVSMVRYHDDMFTGCPLEKMPDRQPKFKINEDFLDKQDVQLDSVSVLEDAREDIDRWIENDVPLPFNPQILSDGFFRVEGRKQLGTIIDKAIRDFGHECSLNWLDVSKVEMMNWLFSGKDFNGEISRWDTSGVTDMQAMFYESTFNNNISQWDVSNVDNMFGIFNKCPFCHDISMWNCASMKPDALERAFSTSKLPDEYKPKLMYPVNEDFLDKHDIQLDSINVLDDARAELDEWFRYGKEPSFNPEILPDGFYPVNDKTELVKVISKAMKFINFNCSLNWIDVSKITDMCWLFHHSLFNGDISRWDVSSVENMQAMFYQSDFNSDISGWDVSEVSNMYAIFNQCPFCHDISMWNCASMDPDDLKRSL